MKRRVFVTIFITYFIHFYLLFYYFATQNKLQGVPKVRSSAL